MNILPMLTKQHMQEDLSRAYIQAVAAKAGVNLTIGGQVHDYGVDGTFHQVALVARTTTTGKQVQRRLNSGFNLDFQCKASCDWDEEPTFVVYDLEARTYNDLVFRSDQRRATPLILILMCLPKDEREWLLLSEDELLLRKCCYWHRLTGQETGNENTKRIRVPRSQKVDPETIRDLLARVESGALQ